MNKKILPRIRGRIFCFEGKAESLFLIRIIIDKYKKAVKVINRGREKFTLCQSFAHAGASGWHADDDAKT